jgi:hypothetical protein
LSEIEPLHNIRIVHLAQTIVRTLREIKNLAQDTVATAVI